MLGVEGWMCIELGVSRGAFEGGFQVSRIKFKK